jgi:hypothetical protein
MLTLKGEFSALFMIETCPFPALFTVAGLALLAISPTMLVIILMTAVAILFWFYFCYRFFMAGFAGNLLVLAL